MFFCGFRRERLFSGLAAGSVLSENNYPAARSGVSRRSEVMSEVKCQLLFKDFFIGPLVRYILWYALVIRILAHRIGIIAACPQVSSPKQFLNFFMLHKYFSGSYAFDYRHHFAHRHRGHALHKKMHMVFFHPYLHKMEFVTQGYPYAHIFQCLRYTFGEYLSPVFRRKYQMIQQQSLIVMFIDMFIHACNIAYFNSFSKPTQGAGY